MRTRFRTSTVSLLPLLFATVLSGKAIAQQNIVGGELTPIPLQQRLGLVRVGDCSGTLLNRFWVLTAESCITQGPNADPAPFDQRKVTAAWSDRVVTPTRYVRYRAARRVDVALVFLGAGDFGPVSAPSLHRNPLQVGAKVTQYGRGIHALATRSGSPPVDIPAQADGLYRSADLHVSASERHSYTLPTNSAGQSGNAGDSGGPDIISDDGALVSISGVSSSCTIGECLPGKSCDRDFTWATRIRHCQSAPLFDIFSSIELVVREGLRQCSSDISAGCTVSEMTHLLLLP